MDKNTEVQHQGQKQDLNVAPGRFKFSTGLRIIPKLLADTTSVEILVEESLDLGASPTIKKWNDNYAMYLSAVSFLQKFFTFYQNKKIHLKNEECFEVYFYPKAILLSASFEGQNNAFLSFYVLKSCQVNIIYFSDENYFLPLYYSCRTKI